MRTFSSPNPKRAGSLQGDHVEECAPPPKSEEKYKAFWGSPQLAMGWDAALHECWRAEPVQKSHTELAVRMQGAALGSKTVGNYRPKAKAFIDFCDSEGPQRLPAEEATVRLYIAHLLAKVEAAAAAGEERTVRTWLPARHVLAVHDCGLQLWPVRDAGLWAQGSPVVMAGQGSYWRMLWELGKLQSAQANDWLSSAIHIDPTAIPAEHMERYFGWATPRWQQQQQQPGTEQRA
ncbi:hypothetical protein CYMTET_53501 [Cymbomonas tetramitiformis]|uniref:Uncharacterized protein n=1 Tax=Cymbomonas tetramitiformis TaxID=36881 RepID=A0AAE0BGR8_9CHLO|nr:hypothetical protein CYMTET_53501 [Cymbomonas tetramitiformis]